MPGEVRRNSSHAWALHHRPNFRLAKAPPALTLMEPVLRVLRHPASNDLFEQGPTMNVRSSPVTADHPASIVERGPTMKGIRQCSEFGDVPATKLLLSLLKQRASSDHAGCS